MLKSKTAKLFKGLILSLGFSIAALLFWAPAVHATDHFPPAPTHDSSCTYTICNSHEITDSKIDFNGDTAVVHFPAGDITFNKASQHDKDMKFTPVGGNFCQSGGFLNFHYMANGDLHGESNLYVYSLATKTCQIPGSSFLRTIFDNTGKDPCVEDGGNQTKGTCTKSGGSSFSATGNPNTQTIQSAQLQNSIKQNPIFKDLQDIVNFLSAAAVIVIVLTIILGGIQYAAAGDKPDALGAAKKRIGGGIGALLGFFLMYAFLQWLIPGGIFSR